MIIIKCPKCGAEYTLAEVFYPDTILGKPSNIVRDEKGRIEHIVCCEEPTFQEDWECYECGCKMVVKASVDVKVEEAVNEFDEDYSSTIYKNRINLEE